MQRIDSRWKKWKKDVFWRYLDIVFDSFGINRTMFGSDWPVCLLSIEYENVKAIAEYYLQSFTEVEKQKVFCFNAIRFYNLEIKST